MCTDKHITLVGAISSGGSIARGFKAPVDVASPTRQGMWYDVSLQA